MFLDHCNNQDDKGFSLMVLKIKLLYQLLFLPTLFYTQMCIASGFSVSRKNCVNGTVCCLQASATVATCVAACTPAVCANPVLLNSVWFASGACGGCLSGFVAENMNAKCIKDEYVGTENFPGHCSKKRACSLGGCASAIGISAACLPIILSCPTLEHACCPLCVGIFSCSYAVGVTQSKLIQGCFSDRNIRIPNQVVLQQPDPVIVAPVPVQMAMVSSVVSGNAALRRISSESVELR